MKGTSFKDIEHIDKAIRAALVEHGVQLRWQVCVMEHAACSVGTSIAVWKSMQNISLFILTNFSNYSKKYETNFDCSNQICYNRKFNLQFKYLNSKMPLFNDEQLT